MEDKIKKKKDFKTCAAAFNEMPFEHRAIAADAEMIARIRDLKILKNRLRENYERELQWINGRIKSYESSLS